MQPDELIERLKSKDQKAFKSLYDMYSESLHGVIFSIVKDNALAEELLQDTFIKIWNNAKTYTSKKGRFFTWALNIARNHWCRKVCTSIKKEMHKTYRSIIL